MSSELKDKTIAIIGCGNMGGALMSGLCEQKLVKPSSVIACDRDTSKSAKLAESLGAKVQDKIGEAARNADVVVLAVKPQDVGSVLASMNFMKVDKVPRDIVSVVTGTSIRRMREALGNEVTVTRVMPNVASLIGKGVSGIYSDRDEGVAIAQQLFDALGETVVLRNEDEVNIVNGLGGAGPGFMFTIIEAFADAGVKMGLSREAARAIVVATMQGSAALVRETGKHPAELRDLVTTPGGTTIAGLHQLERAGVRGGIISTIEASVNRARELDEG